jgi:hypothetical protein
MRLQYDKGGKWLIEHHADAILKLAGVGPVTSWTPLPGELVQSRQLPDGLIEARIAGIANPVLFLIEINTYPYTRVAEELLDDVAMTYLNRRVVPEVIALTLCEKGNVRIDPNLRLISPLGHTRLEAGWRVVNLWELNASDFLPLTDPGLAPWVPLTKIDGSAEHVLQQCKDVIETKTSGGEQKNLFAVTEILAGLRFNEKMLEAMFRGAKTMIESPILQQWLREDKVKTLHQVILDGLAARFGSVPEDLSASIRFIQDPDLLTSAYKVSYTCDSLNAFRQILTSLQHPAAN